MTSTFWISSSDLDKEQKEAVENIPETTSFLLKGPAGSGKTNILLLRASWLTYKKLTDFKIIVFTASLRDFVSEGCKLYNLNPGSAITQMSFLKNVLQEYFVQYDLSDDFETDRNMLSGKVMSLIDSGQISDNYCTTLLIDEAQDYTDTELLVFRRLTKNLVLACDSRQSIYKTTHTPGALERLVDNKVVNLRYHYRSGLKLCKVADAILSDSAAYPKMQGECHYPEDIRPSSVAYNKCSSLQEQFELIVANIQVQLDLYPGEPIGVLFPKREQADNFQLYILSTIDIIRVRVDTLHGAKGWEFRAVHIGGCELLYRMGSVQKRLIYTGILRGKTTTILYYSGHLPGYLEAALAVLEPPSANPSLDELFREK